MYIFLLVYVDDFIVTGSSSEEINKVNNKVINMLSYKFKLKDLGDLTFFLGMELLKN